VDASGEPKAPWHYLRRALAPVTVSLSDEGGNGLGVHVVNDAGRALKGILEIALFRFGEVRVANGSKPVELNPRSAIELNAASFFEGFLDLSYAYRFGPPSHDVAVATLKDNDDRELATAFHFVPGLPSGREMDVGLHAHAVADTNGDFTLSIGTRRFAQSVSLEVAGFAGDDNYFHLAPGCERKIRLRRTDSGERGGEPKGSVHALNSATSATISVGPIT